MQNAFAESFIGRLRDELLNETLFRSLPHTRAVLEAWRADYNTSRPHSRLGWMSPAMSVTYMNEFNVPKPAMNLQAAIYTQHNIEIQIHMPPGRPLRDLRARRIKTNGVVDVPFRN